MAIANLDAVIAGARPPVLCAKGSSNTPVAGKMHSSFTLPGYPGAGSINAGLNGANFSSTSAVPNGIIRHTDPGSGNAYLSRFQASANVVGMVCLLDRLWDNTLTINSTGAQSITQPTLPARDANGSTNGEGVYLAIEVTAVTAATAAVVSVSYTNQAGTSGRTGVFLIAPTAAAQQVGTFNLITLQAGDTGVRSVQSVTFSTAWATGTISLVAFRYLASVDIQVVGMSSALDAVTSGFPQLYNGVCPFLTFLPATAASFSLTAAYAETQG